MTEQTVLCALAKRFCSPTFAFLPQVRNGVGFARKKDRTADAIAVGLWPSRGLDLHGFEVKVSRADWKKELADPSKSAEIQRFCDRWWIAVSHENVLAAGELPPTWGLMVLDKRGAMKVIREAPKLDAQPLDRLMMASIFRKVAEVMEGKLANSVPREEFNERLKKEVADSEKLNAGYREQEMERMRRTIEKFEAASGVKMSEWRAEETGAAVKFLSEIGLRRFRTILADVKHSAESLLKISAEAIERYDADTKR